MHPIFTLNTAQLINQLAFLIAFVIVVIFYSEYKKCIAQIEKQEMLNQFLND
jgi:hypothetical protein